MYTTAGGAAMATLIKGGTWLFASVASRNADRRVDLTTIITRQDVEIQELKEEVERCEAGYLRRIRELEERAAEADRQSARMEGVLYRMGYERTDRGWRRHEEGGGNAT